MEAPGATSEATTSLPNRTRPLLTLSPSPPPPLATSSD